jgi:UDP:flavonoid glycosyltransferase YjiC (YdhE family)
VRILVVSAPLVGHLLPMLPLALALRDAGHDVLVATGGDAVAAVPPGLAGVDLAPGFELGRVARGLMLRHPLVARAELAGTAGTRGVSLLFGKVNDGLIDPVFELTDSWQPDLVVHEPLAPAGAVAAARAGIPAVLHGTSLFDDVVLTAVSAAAMRPRGISAPPPHGTVLRIAPTSVVGPRDGHPMRPVLYAGADEVPEDFRGSADRPLILVSRSTISGPGGGDLMSAVVAAAPGLAADIVLMRPDPRLVSRGALPANVRTVGWLPMARALPGCAGIVHHGGSGTVLAALAAGVPQIAVVGPGDRRHNAELVAARGAGLAVSARQLTTEHLRRLVADAELAAAAAAVGTEIAAMPAPAELVQLVMAARA